MIHIKHFCHDAGKLSGASQDDNPIRLQATRLCDHS